MDVCFIFEAANNVSITLKADLKVNPSITIVISPPLILIQLIC